MARRYDHVSVQGGSDTLRDITCTFCTPCGEDGLQYEALTFCPECQEYMCAACTKCHQRMKATREHKLIGPRQTKLNHVVVKTESTEKCWYHTDREIEMYCKTHDMVYCARCIATEHRTCGGVTDVDHASEKNYIQDDLQKLLTETDEVYEQLAAIKKKRENVIEATDKRQTKTLNKVKELERKMVRHIEKLGKEATDALKEKYTEVKNELETGMPEVNQMVRKIERRKRKLEEAGHMDNTEKFVQVKMSKKAKDDAKKLYKETDDSGPSEVIQFTEYRRFTEAVMKTESFAVLGVIDKIEQKKKLNISMVETEADDEFKCFIVDLCQIEDGRIVLVDQRNRKLKALDEMDMVNGVWQCEREPTGICSLGRNEVAVKYKSNEIEFYTLSGGSLDTSRDPIQIKGGGSWGLTYFAGDLWMSYRNGVKVYSTAGVLKKHISYIPNQNGGNVLSSPVHLSGCKSSIFLANESNGVVCLDKDGSLKYELQDERLRGTRGVCVTSRGTVLVAGFKSNNVVVFNKNGKCIGDIVTQDMMPQKGPLALLYDSGKNRLLMACMNSGCILAVS